MVSDYILVLLYKMILFKMERDALYLVATSVIVAGILQNTDSQHEALGMTVTWDTR